MLFCIVFKYLLINDMLSVEYEDDILDCWWLSGTMDCAVQPGFKFNRVISHELTLEIPRVTEKHIGGYACKLQRMNPKDIRPCELEVQQGKQLIIHPLLITFISVEYLLSSSLR